jgi:hypothetical protein
VTYDFTFGKKTLPLATAIAAAPPAQVPFVAQPQRCDLHAFAENKSRSSSGLGRPGRRQPLAIPVPVVDVGKVLDTYSAATASRPHSGVSRCPPLIDVLRGYALVM